MSVMAEQRTPENRCFTPKNGTSPLYDLTPLKPVIGAIDWLFKDRLANANANAPPQQDVHSLNSDIDSNEDTGSSIPKREYRAAKQKKKKSKSLNSTSKSKKKDPESEWTNVPLRGTLNTPICTDRLCRCKVCGQLLPQDIDSIERHTNHCGNIEAGHSCWEQAIALRALSPKELVGSHIELHGGVIATVVEVDKRTGAYGSKARHLLRFESGREESTLLFDGKNDGTLFRLLSFEEERRYNELVRQRLEEELRSVRLHMQDIRQDSVRRSKENESIRSELEHFKEETADRSLCPVCFDSAKDTVFNCGHRACSSCAQLCVDSEGGLCPICRQPIENSIKLFDI